MTTLKRIQIRLTQKQVSTLTKLSTKTGLDRTNVIRLAIARLAESEGISNPPGRS